MHLRRAAAGRVLGDGMFADRHHLADTRGASPVLRDTQHSGHVQLLHERHHHGVHRRPDSRDLHRTLQPASARRSYSDEDARLQPRETARRPLHRHHFHIHVDRERGGHRHDGAHRLRCSPRVGEGRRYKRSVAIAVTKRLPPARVYDISFDLIFFPIEIL